jgi:hypothetical protein
MLKRVIGALLFGATALAGMAHAQQGTKRVGAFPVTAEVVQVIKQFDNPEGAIFSQDGRHVFISNSAEIGDRGDQFGWTEGEGYISKLEVQQDGTLEVVEEG